MAYITHRKRSWFAQVNRQGIRRSKSFPTRRAAQAWADELEARIIAGPDPLENITLGDLITRYERNIGRLRPWGKSKSVSLRTCRGALGELTLHELTVEALTEFATARAIAGAGPATVLHDLVSLGACLKIGRILWRYPIAPNLVGDACTVLRDMQLVAPSVRRERVIHAPELAALERAWKSAVVPFDLVRFALASCMRQGELFAIRWDDYNPTFRTVLVRDRKHPTLKAGNHQLVPLLGDAAEILARRSRGEDPRIWPYSQVQIWRAWDQARAAAGLRDARFHDLRHTGLTAMFRKGWTIEQVSIVSGHRSWASLRRYTHIVAGDLVALEDARRAVRGLEIVKSS